MTADRSLRTTIRIALILATAIALGQSASAKDPANDAIGFTPNHVFEDGLAGENVDLMSGNLSLTIPIGPKYMLSDRYGYQVILHYNSKLWEHDCPDFRSPSSPYCPGLLLASDHYGLGFDLSFGRIYRTTYEDTGKNERPTVWRYQSADGSDHQFCLATASDSCTMNQWAPSSSDPDNYTALTCDGSTCQGITLDGSGIRLLSVGADSYVAYPGDGTKIILTGSPTSTFPGHAIRRPWDQLGQDGHTLDTNVRWEDSWYASRIESLDLNAGVPVWSLDIHHDSTGRVTSIDDSAGRHITIGLDAGEFAIKVPKFTGNETTSDTYARYVLNFQPVTIKDPGPPYRTRSVNVLESIEYPVRIPVIMIASSGDRDHRFR